ncbi:MAG: hypothetical protein ACE5D2_08305 [Fidelibacterota bacterium]
MTGKKKPKKFPKSLTQKTHPIPPRKVEKTKKDYDRKAEKRALKRSLEQKK